MSDTFVINYHKRIIGECEKSFLNEFGITKMQLYNPIYSSFFKLSKRNFNSIALNHKYSIKNINLVFKYGTLTDDVKHLSYKPIFIKFSPLLDPMKYMTGRYDLNDPNISSLPQYSSSQENCHSKLLCLNNASYVDNFFYFLSSVLLNHHYFLHGTDYYGSFLGIQNKFKCNIADDLDFLTSSDFFIANNGKIFNCEEVLDEYQSAHTMTRKNKSLIAIGDDIDLSTDIQASEFINNDEQQSFLASVVDLCEEDMCEEDMCQIVVDDSTEIHVCDADYNSDSDNSNTDYSIKSSDSYEQDNEKIVSQEKELEEKELEENGLEENELDDDDIESFVSTSSQFTDTEDIFAYINNFPVQMICLEECDNTLDSLFEEGNVDDKIGASLFFQIVMTLLAYQKVFDFTHNDLHSNNIMYVATQKKFLCYRYNNIDYKVPTYGRIIKIIDFGRSIYKFHGKTFCSDSFSPDGDGESQYNCEPFFNENKKRVDPNYSFDLCRLGCSLHSYIDDNTAFNANNMTQIRETVTRWITDDNNYNILYKKNGDERYKGFKLYKMIARTVTSHTPERQLEYDFFKQFKITKRVKHMRHFMNLDTLPMYWSG